MLLLCASHIIVALLQRFLCNICLLQRKDESDIAAHVQAEHEARDSDLSADMNSTSDNEATSDEEAESPRAPARRQNRQSYRPKPCGPQRMFISFCFFTPRFLSFSFISLPLTSYCYLHVVKKFTFSSRCFQQT